LTAHRHRAPSSPPSRFRYVPAHLLAGRPHVIVDGAARGATAYTLSHWPRTPTPAGLEGDLSAEIVRDALRQPGVLPPGVELASIDHYDVDGVVALGLGVLEGLDAAHGPLLVEAARVGDFDVVTDRRAALIAFALNGLFDHGEALGLPAPVVSADPLEYCGAVTEHALGLLVALAEDPDRFESWWGDEWSAYEASVRALSDGWATIEEVPELDLAVVRVAADHDGAAAAWKSAPLHRAAVHSATTCLRVATVAGARMELRYRYESWVRLTSHRPRPRVDLTGLARALTAAEKQGARWEFDGAGAITAALHLAGDEATSTLGPGRFVEQVRDTLVALDDGPAAWDPYRRSDPPGRRRRR
jgi:hypothetical protein